MLYNNLMNETPSVTKIKLQPVSITYTKTITFTPNDDTFADWDVEPSQEGFESYVLDEFFNEIYDDVRPSGDVLSYTDVVRLDPVEIEWDDEE